MSTIEDLTIYGPWIKDRVLGVGGFGIVSLWKNTENDKYLALKKCRWDNIGVNCGEMVSKKQKERWSKEVDIMKRLSHRNMVRSIPLPHEFQSMKSELPILSMEFCSLGDLRQVLNKPENCCGLQELEVRQIIKDIKSAVAYLHSEKITHRDLKPENIVLQSDPDTPGGVIYKLIDLGYAKELDQSSICNSFVGTLQYLAPELYLNSVYTSSVDYWSLGLVSHEVITGVRPFLPNMPPTQWMMHVEKKNADVICAYQRVGDNHIVFRKELFKENHISDYLRVQLEKWLMVALEWNPDRRGRVNKELIIFNMIDDIFAKKIILVFCVEAYKRLSYEVDSATAVSTLKTWIERDANQPLSQQLLLLPTGERLADDRFAIDCWDPTIQDVMLYVLPTNGFQLPRTVSPYFPELVQFLLKNNKENVDYPMKKRIWANAVYFIHQELFLYQCMLDAYAVKMLWLVSFEHRLRTLFQELCAKLQDLKGTLNLAQKSLSCDQRFFHPVLITVNRTSSTQKQLLSCYEQIVVLHTEKLKQESTRQVSVEETIRGLGNKINKVKARIALLQTFLEPSRTKLSEMKNALRGSYKNYSNLIAKKKNEQFQNAPGVSSTTEQTMMSNSFDMFKLVYKFLKVRDKALNDEEFIVHLQEVTSSESELLTLESQLQSLVLEINASSGRLINMHLKRQEELWTLVRKLSQLEMQGVAQIKPIGDDTQQLVPSVNLPSVNNDLSKTANRFSVTTDNRSSVEETAQPGCLHSTPHNSVSQKSPQPSASPIRNGGPLVFQLDDSSVLPSENFNDLVLDEHLSLRCEWVECMTRTHETVQSIRSETQSFDWKSLYDM